MKQLWQKRLAGEAPSEGMIIFILCAVQIIHIVDVMMVVPLGADFSRALGIPLNKAGMIAGAYSFASAFAGIVMAVFLDRFDRRTAMLVAVLGLAVFTGGAALAWDFNSLFIVRCLAGLFGGPCTAICYAIVADVIPEQRRAAAMSKVVASFSIASVLGVPFGLELARVFDWHAPFVGTAICAFCVAGMIFLIMPSMTGHMRHAEKESNWRTMKQLVWNPLHMMVFGFASCGMLAGFLIIPHIASFVQENMHFPREHLGLLYMAGGAASFMVLRVSGNVMNRFDASRVALFSLAGYAVTIYFGMVWQPFLLSPFMLYICFMSFMSMRTVAVNTLASKVPAPHQRAGFLSIMNCVAQTFSSIGAFISSSILSVGAAGELVGMEIVVYMGIAVAVLVPLLMWLTERNIDKIRKAKPIITAPEANV